MKQTIQANIGGIAFTLDDDAYRTLNRYLEEVRRHMPAADTETMDDIERRIAELLRERVTTSMHVVSIGLVREVMAQMGEPADFGPGRGEACEADTAKPQPCRLTRSRNDRAIAGVCGGLGRYLDIDATLLRIVTALLVLCGGLSVWIYVILWIVIPEEPARRIDGPLHR